MLIAQLACIQFLDQGKTHLMGSDARRALKKLSFP